MMKGWLMLLLFFTTFFMWGRAPLVLPEILNPQHLDVNDKYLYVADEEKVFIYSLEKGILIKSFGKRGEGPGEFKFPPDFTVTNKEIICVDRRNKILYFTPLGQFIKEIKTPTSINEIIYLKDGFLGQKWIRDRKKTNQIYQLILFDKNFKVKKIIDTVSTKIRVSKDKKQIFDLMEHKFQAWAHKDLFYVGDTRKGMSIEVYNLQGKKVHTILKEFKKRPAGDAYIKAWIKKQKVEKTWDRIKNIIKLTCSDYYPSFLFFRVSNDHIYIIDHPLKPEGTHHDILVLDLKGNVIHKQMIKMVFPYRIKNHKVYSLEMNEEEKFQLRIQLFNRK